MTKLDSVGGGVTLESGWNVTSGLLGARVPFGGLDLPRDPWKRELRRVFWSPLEGFLSTRWQEGPTEVIKSS